MKRKSPPVIIAVSFLVSLVAAFAVALPLREHRRPSDAVSYQSNVAHDGWARSRLKPPLVKQWEVQIGGEFDRRASFPLIVGDRVFVATTSDLSYGARLYSLDAFTGRVLWGPVELGGVYFWSGLAYDRGRLFTVTADARARAIDPANGSVIWDRQVGLNYSVSSQPVAAGGMLFVPGNYNLTALDEETGSTLWTSSGGDRTAPTLSDHSLFINCAALDPTNGAVLWSIPWACGDLSPVYHSGRLYVRGAYGNWILDAATGSSIRSFTADVAPAFDGELGFFVSNGELRAEDADGFVAWRFTDADGVLRIAPLVSNGHVYVATSTGVIYALNKRDGNIVWRDQTGPIESSNEHGSLFVGMSIGGNMLVVPAGNSLVAFANSSLRPTIGPVRELIHDLIAPTPSQSYFSPWPSRSPSPTTSSSSTPTPSTSAE